MKKLRAVLLSCLLAVSLFGLSGCADKTSVPLEQIADFVLEVPAGRDVTVLQLTDIQIIDSSQRRKPERLPSWSVENWAPENMEKLAFSHMREIVNRVKPDLIVLSGDNVYGEFDDAGTTLQRLIAEMESYEIPWTLTFGNHDNETRKGVEWTCAQYQNAPHCLFTRGPVDTVQGNGNFTVAVTQGGRLTEVIFLMDSNGHTDSDVDQNMFSSHGLFPAQIEWFTQKCEQFRTYNGGASPKSIGFFHHPLRAYGDGLSKYGYVSARHDFFTADGDYGNFTEVIVPTNDRGDSGAMHTDAGEYIDGDYTFHNLLKTYNCEGWFFGHDHENNASVTHEGVRYTYGLKASEYDSFIKGEIGGTRITLGDGGLRVAHEYAA